MSQTPASQTPASQTPAPQTPAPRTTSARARRRPRRILMDDDGMSTVEYAIGTVAAAAFAAVLYAVVSGDSVVTALTDLVQRALTTAF